MSESCCLIPGGFMICSEMCGNGAGTYMILIDMGTIGSSVEAVGLRLKTIVVQR